MNAPGVPSSGRKAFRGWLWQQLRGHLGTLLLVSFFINLLALATPIFVLQVYDRVVFYGGLTTLQGLVVGMLLVLVFDAVLKVYRARFFQGMALRVDITLGSVLYDKVFTQEARALEARPLAYWQQLFRDAATVRSVVSGAPAALLVDLPFVGIFFVTVMVIAPPLWPVIVVGVILFTTVAIVSERVIRRRAADEQDKVGTSERRLVDLLSNRASLQASGVASRFKPEWDAVRAEAIGAALERGTASDANRVLTQSMTLLFTVAMTTVGALAILEQQMTIGSLIAANMLGSRLVGPLAQLVEQWRVYTQFNQVAGRLEAFLAEPTVVEEAPVNLHPDAGRFSLSELVYRYAEEAPPALDGLQGTVGPGGLHVIMGRNGCGKSTLLKLLAGDYAPTEGTVQLDGANLRQFAPVQRHAVIGCVAQRPELLNATLYDNIVFGRYELDEEDVVIASKAVGLHEQVAELPHGYQTWIAEGQRGVSGGLLQKIALARAVAGPRRVLLLDEPTSGLDAESEMKLAALLKKHAQARTVIVASHSPLLVQQADTLMLLEQGKVVIAGPASAVRAKLAEGGVRAAGAAGNGERGHAASH